MTDWLDKSLQQLAAEDPPAEALADVRLRVLDRVRLKHRAWRWYLVPAAAAASLAIWFALPLPRPAAAPARPPVEIAKVETAKTFQPRILPTGSPDFVQVESGDPDVVILWSMNSPTITDQPGENK